MQKNNLSKGTILYGMVFFLVCAVIFGCVIFIRPIVGVADQGDFARVFFGIEWPYPDFWSSDHFYKYVTPDYRFTPFPYEQMIQYPFAASQIYFVYMGRLVSSLIGLDRFSQYAYAVFCALLYILGLTAIYMGLLPERKAPRVLLGLGLILVFMDGRWLQWLNSLYGEPIVMIGVLLTAGVFLLLVRSEGGKIPLYLIVLLFIAEFIMIGGKLQALPFLLTGMILSCYLVPKLWRRKPARRNRYKVLVILALTALQFYYCSGLYQNPEGALASKDRIFQSVFTGLLANAGDPEKALRELNLAPEFIQDIGKTAYLPEVEYTFGPLHGPLMQKEFYDKVNNPVILKYYLTHPGELFKGLLYSGEKTLIFAGNGIHPRGEEYAIEHNRFVVWSKMRERLPKSFWFLCVLFLAAVAVAVIWFKRGQRELAGLLLAFLIGGGLQFPMPYLLNGTCDTAKQLLVFNFIFDVCFLAVVAFIMGEIYRLFTPVDEDEEEYEDEEEGELTHSTISRDSQD